MYDISKRFSPVDIDNNLLATYKSFGISDDMKDEASKGKDELIVNLGLGNIFDTFYDNFKDKYSDKEDAKTAFLTSKGSLIRFGSESIFTNYFSNILVDDYLLITILGNLMDNAIEASEKLEKELRIIELSISQLDSYLDICIKNNHREVIIKSGQDFVSTKKESGTADNRLFHGIGLKNVRKTVEKLNGHINIEYTDTTFAVSALIPNY